MNSKTIQVRVPDQVISLPLVLSNYPELKAYRVSIGSNTSISSNLETHENLLSSHKFHLPLSRDVSYSDWLEEINITGDTNYKVLVNIVSKNGIIPLKQIEGGVILKEFEAEYKITIEWNFGGSEIIYSGSGATYSGNISSEYILENYENINIPVEPYSFSKIVRSPVSATKATLKIEAFSPLLVSNDYMLPIKYPEVTVTNTYVGVPIVVVKTSASVNLLDNTKAILISPKFSPVEFDFLSNSENTDRWGEKNSQTFDTTGEILNIGHGHILDSKYKAWIPFEVEFPQASKGCYVVSAYLIVTPTTTRTYVPATPCILNIGFQNEVSPTPPSNVNELFSLTTVDTEPYIITKNWVEGEEYRIDVTKSARKLFGQNGIKWEDNDIAAILISDYNSFQSEYRIMASSRNPLFSSPKLAIKYANTYYPQEAYDLTMIDSKPKISYRDILIVGGKDDEPVHRSLLYFKTHYIPSTASVVSSSLTLSPHSYEINEASKIQAYAMETEWDANTASWDYKNGTNEWDPGSFDSLTLLGEFTPPVGSSPASINIPLNEVFVEEWISGNSPNKGILLVSELEGQKQSHRFYSSQMQFSLLDKRPKLNIKYLYGGTETEISIRNLHEGGVLPPEDPSPPVIPPELPVSETLSVDIPLEFANTIYSGIPNDNFGDGKHSGYYQQGGHHWVNVHTYATSAGSEKGWRGLLKPDMSLLPQNSEILSVTLRVYTAIPSFFDNEGMPSIDALYVLRKGFTYTYATWINAKYSDKWNIGGAESSAHDRYSTELGRFNSSKSGWFNIPLNVGEFQKLVSNNTGILIKRIGGVAGYYGKTGSERAYVKSGMTFKVTYKLL